MSYRLEGKDIVISGFENGISGNPYEGISDMRNINNTTIPGEASVAFKTSVSSPTAVTGSFSVTLASPITTNYTSTTSLLIPAGSTVNVEAWGGGASGAGIQGGVQGRGGGGGGAYSKKSNIAVTPGTTYTITVGQGGAQTDNNAGNPGGDSWFSTSGTVLAKGGGAAATSTGGTGGQAAAGIGDTKFSGGNGGNGDASGGPDGGGGGGGGAGTANNGTNGSNANGSGGGGAGGAGGATGGGTGGAGGNSGQPGVAGTTLAGAGGGAGEGASNGGAAGARGEVRVTYVPTAPSVVYTGLVGTLANYRAIVFSGGGLPGGITAGNIYYIGDLNTGAGTFNLYTRADLDPSSIVYFTSSGSGTFAGVVMGEITYFARYTSVTTGLPVYTDFCVDSNGRVWSYYTTASAWTYLGNTLLTGAYGNGLGIYHGYIFVWRAAYLDYIPFASYLNPATWVYGWNPDTGGAGPTTISNLGAPNSAFSHETITATDDVMYSCDATYLQSFRVESPTTTFDPTNTATFVWAQKALRMPLYDMAQSLAELGTNLLIGGALNAIYPWDRVSPSFNYPILLSDSFVKRMITVNTNTYALVGRRGKMYVTNGAQAEEFIKISDYISSTVEPYYEWGGVAADRDNIYFGVKATTNAGVAINQYGGLWAVGVESKSVRLLNKLSYGTYAGIASAILARQQNYEVTPPVGYGLYIGWEDGTGNGGIDSYPGTPYSGGEAYIDLDMIPVGTFLKPFTPSQLEWKTSAPLVAGESIALYYRGDSTSAYTLITTPTSSFAGAVSDLMQANFQKIQWVQIRVVLTSTNTTPSYCRLTEVRIRDYPNT